jgi:cobalt-zinc-cadmium efflux system membrane fusion protein
MTFMEIIIQQKQTVITVGALIMLLGTGFGFAQWVSDSHGAAQTSESNDLQKSEPIFIRKGEQIVVPEHSPMRSQLVVQVVDAHEMPRALVVPANVEADPSRTANILPPVTGKVAELKVHLGDYVTRGQALVVLASGDFSQAYADVNKSRDALQLGKRALDRARGVFDAGGSASKDVEQAESNYTQALDEYQRAEERIKAIGGTARIDNKTSLLTLTAPMSGYVTALSTAPGAFVNDATASIMTIANLDSIWFTAFVPENSVSFVTKGQKVGITLPAYPGEVFNGTVAFVSAVLEPDTRSDKVRITFENKNGKFKPNMFANASFMIPQVRQTSVPNSALLMNNDSTTVFVEVAPWTFVRRTIELGYEEGNNTLIREGLNPGDRLIVKGGVLLND